MARVTCGLTAILLLAVLAWRAEGVQPPDYQQLADQAKWDFPVERSGLLWSVAQELGDYEVQIVRKQGRFFFTMTIRVLSGGQEVHSWTGHAGTMFVERGGVLYYTEYSPIATGCTLVAFDLCMKKELWRTNLKGIGPVGHSKYRNRVHLEEDQGALRVTGDEASGRYVEYVDPKTGKTLGHKRFQER